MNIKLAGGAAVSVSDIAALQHIIGEPLVPEFLEFVKSYDGAKPELNIFDVGADNNAGVNEFIPVKEIAEEMQYIENLPDRSYPIACAEGGNYIFINQADGGAVFFWDHELPEDITRLADDFRSFLEMLEPFDIASITIKPGQVTNAWISPDFLKSLGRDI